MWSLLEPIHALTYFDPACQAAFEAAGLRGFWRGYFAGRAAPLGPVGPAPVTALFYNFAPRMAARGLPAVWELATPAQALTARADGAAAALRSAVADDDLITGAGRLADQLWPIVAAAPADGRALGAANLGLERPGDPCAALWQAATTVRELRGDGHAAALLSGGISGLEALVLRSALDLDATLLFKARGWTLEEWSAAAEGLATRGLVTFADDPASGDTPPEGDGPRTTRITDAGRRFLADVERRTDLAAAAVWTPGWSTGAETGVDGPGFDGPGLAAALLPIAQACALRLPVVTPIGLGHPWDVVADPGGPGALIPA